MAAIDNLQMASIARLAGAPLDKGAGVDLKRKVGDRVHKGQTLYTIYADFPANFDFACEAARQHNGYTLNNEQASLRSRERFWDIRVPKIDSIFDNSLVPRPSWSPGVPPQHRKLVAATHRSPI